MSTGLSAGWSKPAGLLWADPVCYRLKFSDGDEITADGEHIWRTSALRTGCKKGPKAAGFPRKGDYALRTTAEIAQTVAARPTKSRHPQAKWNHRVDLCRALELPEVILPKRCLRSFATPVWRCRSGERSCGGHNKFRSRPARSG